MKSAYQLALERLERDGIERPREDALSPEIRQQMEEIRQRAEAKLAELEILHRGRRTSATATAGRDKSEQDYRAERERIESKRDRDIERLRAQAGR